MTASSSVWMPLYVGDYFRDTNRLTTEQHGAYLLLIMDYWAAGPPPADDESLARVTRLPLKSWRQIRPVLEAYFTEQNGKWRHKRIDKELAKAHQRVEASEEGNRKRWGEGGIGPGGRDQRGKRLTEARNRGTHTQHQWEAPKTFCKSSCVRCGATAGLVKHHIVPMYQGGSDSIQNLQPLCRKCSSAVGPSSDDMRPEGWSTAIDIRDSTPPEMPPPKAIESLPNASKPSSHPKSQAQVQSDVADGAGPTHLPPQGQWDLVNLAAKAASCGGVAHVQPATISRNIEAVSQWLKEGATPDLILAAIRDRLSTLDDETTVSSLNFYASSIRKRIALKDNPDGPAKPSRRRASEPTTAGESGFLRACIAAADGSDD